MHIWNFGVVVMVPDWSVGWGFKPHTSCFHCLVFCYLMSWIRWILFENRIKLKYILPDRALLLRMCCVLSFNCATKTHSFFDLLVNVFYKHRMCHTNDNKQDEERPSHRQILHGGDLYCKWKTWGVRWHSEYVNTMCAWS